MLALSLKEFRSTISILKKKDEIEELGNVKIESDIENNVLNIITKIKGHSVKLKVGLIYCKEPIEFGMLASEFCKLFKDTKALARKMTMEVKDGKLEVKWFKVQKNEEELEKEFSYNIIELKTQMKGDYINISAPFDFDSIITLIGGINYTISEKKLAKYSEYIKLSIKDKQGILVYMDSISIASMRMEYLKEINKDILLSTDDFMFYKRMINGKVTDTELRIAVTENGVLLISDTLEFFIKEKDTIYPDIEFIREMQTGQMIMQNFKDKILDLKSGHPSVSKFADSDMKKNIFLLTKAGVKVHYINELAPADNNEEDTCVGYQMRRILKAAHAFEAGDMKVARSKNFKDGIMFLNISCNNVDYYLLPMTLLRVKKLN